MKTRLLLLLATLATATLATLTVCGLGAPGVALADHGQTSLFQDDQYLIYDNTATVERTLARLEGVGVEQVRVNLEWADVAPDPEARRAPAGFQASNPASYPASGWAPFDRLVALAPLYGVTVDFTITSPGPVWGMGARPRTADVAQHWKPNDSAFEKFVYAAGLRYSGGYDGLPRVSTWSIWNEPNQPGWLAPQWLGTRGREVAQSPRIYRGLVNAGYAGLIRTGHAGDTILIGETAPEGDDEGGFYTPMTPLPFLRDLYCVDGRYRPLRGAAAEALGCPTKGSDSTFVKANPALFDATGWAHHPYFFTHSPTFGGGDPEFIPLAHIGRLTAFLDGAYRAYGIRRALPIYLTEYGYQTRPPDPYEGVPLATQAAWLNEADYLAWRDPRVREVAQFLLYDAAPNHEFKPSQYGYWDTFQTGLLFQNGKPKASYYAYRMPIVVPDATPRAGTKTFIWGQARPADRTGSQSVAILWRGSRGGYRTIATAHTGQQGYLTAEVRLPGSGTVKLAWDDGGTTLHSRAVAVTVR